ncbi:phosphoribosylaminoimidazolesuccinocarboxamide synthase [Lentisphaera profundi]|uniref:Phosphoribosylaminoimidazole-succinocarboxamide synthase n=1 Tax=Lentisphaera profundi TaxID=1658616 RepID=A0ABY7VU34_9BACT|nr:phosphoribosylaminoimidazolesuccinocarboxamide synthase [Lentisphaera profundi]WDE96824.1 phosphoribosylaminoimidazolesuccinocarboxamide synthase [Lentisphaera profundi]
MIPKVLEINDKLPIRTDGPVHSGKVRSVYWLSADDSARLIKEKNYAINPDSRLAVMVISDRISAFDCIWKGEEGLNGIPGKGAALNSVALHWFKLFEANGLAGNHIVDCPHPLVWIVQQAKPLRVEAICRQYITGSMWRDYAKGIREICGLPIPEGLENNTKLPELIITPSTKGIIRGLDDVPPVDDVNITRKNITDHLEEFNFESEQDVTLYEKLLKEGFNVISDALAKIDQVFVDTKFEFGYIEDAQGERKLIYIDEVGTPDSSRIWDGAAYRQGKIQENSKEGFRQALLSHFPDPDILLNKNRMDEREALARDNKLPLDLMMSVSETYTSIAEKIIGRKIDLPQDPESEIIAALKPYGIIEA